MANLTRTFHKGKMNKTLNERLVPPGEYLDATNIRVSSSEGSEGGVVENAKGNLKLTDITINGQSPINAKCIGSFEDGSNETIYWFVTSYFPSVHDADRADFILSYNTLTDVMTYHVISMQDPNNADQTTLNFNEEYLINSIDLVGDMLFFTDGLNPPRKINVSKSYATPQFADSYMDTVLAEEFTVIKKPPVTAPAITAIQADENLETEDWFEDKFVSFAYRYKYEDGEYSATSQFSAPAFIPNPFELDAAQANNTGATNSVEAVRIDFNTGDKTVVGVDILYKDMDDNIIKVAEKIDKGVSGLSNDVLSTYVFSGSKLYTILPESEILRLYDNVPLTAKTQTIMSNRLFYGNYVEGYDMVDSDGADVRMEYVPYLDSEDVSNVSVPRAMESITVNYGSDSVTSESKVYFRMDGVELKKGYSIDLEMQIAGADTTTSNLEEDSPVTLVWTYHLQEDFLTLQDLVDNEDFKSRIGDASSALPVYDGNSNNSCTGSTLHDMFTCNVENVNSPNTQVYKKFDTTSLTTVEIGDPNNVIFGNDILSIAFPAMMYSTNPDSPTIIELQSFEIQEAELTVSDRAGSGSLKSNRDYEVGMVYMDDFGRSTTALVSKNSSFNIPISKSIKRNSIDVEIPRQQKPPEWATRYKFVIKQDEDDYHTIYSDVYYKDSDSKYTYFLVEGENAAKVEEGDVLIVKRDNNGHSDVVTKVTVLEKKAQEEGFITAISTDGQEVEPIGGIYIKLLATEFSAGEDGSASNDVPFAGAVAKWKTNVQERYPVGLVGPMSNSVSGESYTPIAAGSRIIFNVKFRRGGAGSGDGGFWGCTRRNYDLTIDKVSPIDYPTFQAWFEGEQIHNLLDSGTQDVGGDDDEIGNEYLSTDTFYDAYQAKAAEEYPDESTVYDRVLGSETYNRWFWVVKDAAHPRNPLQQEQASTYSQFDNVYFAIKGTQACGTSASKKSRVEGSLKIISSNGNVVFESESAKTTPDIWYENEQSFPIENGFHMGTTQDQTATDSAIVATTFQNCVTFSNGVESYRINDSIVGRKMKLGNRVTSTQAQDYKRAHRFADLTYSGVINDESNINRLNEFNGGLLNFKALEDSFGPIEIIDGRRTDILVLQEDKISTVLAGKNLLSMSDSVQGGALASVPEVLGQQVARQEDYGISNNPESYVSYGGMRYFTDVKRGAVLQMAGEQIRPISDFGMADYFREQFIDDATTYKLGGYDPYMDEYVLANLESAGAGSSLDVECGRRMSLQLASGEVFTLTVDYGNDIGAANNALVVQGSVDITSTYMSTTTNHGTIANQLDDLTSIAKSSREHHTITYTIEANEASTVEWTAACIANPRLNVVRIVVTDNGRIGDITEAEFRYEDASYLSPTSNQYVTFLEDEVNNTVVSNFDSQVGMAGTGVIPTAGSDVYMAIRDNGVSDFRFDEDANNRMLVLKTNQEFTNSNADVTTILANATELTNVAELPTLPNGDTVWEGSFTLSDTPTDDWLYLVYDLRTYYEAFVSFGADAPTACCNISCAGGTGNYAVYNGTPGSVQFNYIVSGGAAGSVTLSGGQGTTIISETEPTASIVSDRVTIEITSCN